MKSYLFHSKYKTWLDFLLFLVIFVAMSFYYNLNHTMFYRPQSLHAWRQTDCLSMTQNYFQSHNNFLQPEIYNQLSDSGLSGKTAGEFPILYYTIAQIWKVTGRNEFLYRFIVLSIAFTALFLLFKFSKKILNNTFQALFIGLGLYTAVTFVYYSANFLPNIPALAMVMIAWYFIWLFYDSKQEKFLWFAAFFFSLGILLKVSVGISFVALAGWDIIEMFRKKEQRILFKKPLQQFIPFIVVTAVVISWYIYSDHYNHIHNGWYTFNNVWPIWRISNEKVWEIIHTAKLLTRPPFFHISMLYLVGAIWVYLIITFKKRSVFLNYLLVVFPVGSAFYALLWFQALDVHDYYWIDFYINVILVWILFFKTLGKHKWFNSLGVNILVIGFLIFNMVKCNTLLNSRYTGWKNSVYVDHFKAVGELDPVLKKLGIGLNDKVISIPDGSINITLYLMNRKGYCNFNSNFDQPGVFQHRIDQGAKYLIVNDTSILSDSFIKPFTRYPMLTYKNVEIFDLRPYEKANNSE
jgi:hypothetical protein